MVSMSDADPFYSPNLKPQPARVARPGERLFEFLRASDRAPMSCELRFHGESYGWECCCLYPLLRFRSRMTAVARLATAIDRATMVELLDTTVNL